MCVQNNTQVSFNIVNSKVMEQEGAANEHAAHLQLLNKVTNVTEFQLISTKSDHGSSYVCEFLT